MSTGYESGGFGLIHLDGRVTERSRGAGAIADVVARHSALFLAARPVPAEVAVVYNPLVHFVGGRQRAAAYGGPQGEVAGIERDSLLGVYRALFSTNVPLDFVHAEQMTAKDLLAYKLVVLPYPLMMPERAASELREYVRAGGALLAEARAGWNDERGRAAETIPGLGLAEVLGTRETAVESVVKDQAALRSLDDGLPGLHDGESLPGRWYAESLEPASRAARVVARFPSGAPAAVASTFGKGRTLTLGSYVSAAYVSQPEETARRFYRAILGWAGVEPPLTVGGDPVEVRLVQSGADRLAFILNHGSAPATSTVTLRSALEKSRVTDLLTGAPVDVRQVAGGLEWRGTLPPRDVRVLRVSPR
jgi:beta-galactosidase